MENTLTGVAGKKFILSYSCGKDSTLCLHKMLEAGAEPMALLVMFNPEAGRSYFHGVDPALLREYGKALELPLLAVPTGGEEYHLSMEAALRRAKEQGAELVCFGDIDIENNRAWGEERCRNVGLEAVYPLWHHDRQEARTENSTPSPWTGRCSTGLSPTASGSCWIWGITPWRISRCRKRNNGKVYGRKSILTIRFYILGVNLL